MRQNISTIGVPESCCTQKLLKITLNEHMVCMTSSQGIGSSQLLELCLSYTVFIYTVLHIPHKLKTNLPYIRSIQINKYEYSIMGNIIMSLLKKYTFLYKESMFLSDDKSISFPSH